MTIYCCDEVDACMPNVTVLANEGGWVEKLLTFEGWRGLECCCYGWYCCGCHCGCYDEGHSGHYFILVGVMK